jgi:hypothetical protein
MKKNSNKPVFEKTYFNALELKHDPVNLFAKSKALTAVIAGLYDRDERIHYIKHFIYADDRQRIVIRFCKEVGCNPYASMGELRIHVPPECDRISIEVRGKVLANAVADVDTERYIDPTKCRVVFINDFQKKRKPTLQKIFDCCHTFRNNFNAIDDAINANAEIADKLEKICK